MSLTFFHRSLSTSDCLLSLGVADSRVVPDNRIKVSSNLPGYPANEARLNSAKGWCAAKRDKNQFVQVDLGQVMIRFGNFLLVH